MTSYLRITFSAICILMLGGVQAQKKVPFGKTLFRLYKRQPDWAPPPYGGFGLVVPG